jgi:cardiolipin synthase
MEEGSFRENLEKIGKRSFCPGNVIQILKDGVSAFDEVFRAIEKAQRRVCLEYYIFRDDETGWALAELLARRSRAGIEIYLIYDHLGSLGTNNRFWKFLQRHGVQVRTFQPPRLFHFSLYLHRDHRKLVLVDEEVAFTGGLNVGDEYRGVRKKKRKGWRDTGIRTQGPILQSMADAFRESWKMCGGDELPAPPSETAKGAGAQEDVLLLPLFSSSRESMRSLRHLLQYSMLSARHSIHLTMAYFIPTREFLRLLVRAARRGVEVKIILPGQSDLRLVAYVSRTYYQTLCRAGVRLFHYQPRVLHAKTMIFDGIWSIVGSANLDARSLNYNYECGVGILNAQVGQEMEEMFEQDLADSRAITLEEISSWPIHERALGTVLSWFRSYL